MTGIQNIRAFFRDAPVLKTLRPASLTAECAFILPLFFLAAVTLILFMNAVSLQVRTNFDLSNKARQLAVTAGEAQTAFTAAGGGSPAGAADEAGTDPGSGKRLSGSVWIDLSATEIYRFPISLIPKTEVKVATRARVYPWVGIRSWSGTAYEAGPGSGEMVYVTDNREVYHTHADCTHLDLTIIATTLDDVGKLRNEDGKKYRPCDGFPSGHTGTIYVTARGDYYYPSLNYGSLTRHVHLVRRSELPYLPLCERCAGKDRAEQHEAA